eukprot:scaffold7168_cov102-Isochrysis_galbana.AAC.4
MGDEWERGGGVTGRYWTEVSRRVAARGNACLSGLGIAWGSMKSLKIEGQAPLRKKKLWGQAGGGGGGAKLVGSLSPLGLRRGVHIVETYGAETYFRHRSLRPIVVPVPLYAACNTPAPPTPTYPRPTGQPLLAFTCARYAAAAPPGRRTRAPSPF